MPFNRIRPRMVRLEACSLCQLRCPSCPTHSGVVRPAVGNGFVSLSDFQGLLLRNRRLKHVELSNYGEIFLNPDLLAIIQYAHERGVVLSADNGVNFNRASDEILEGLVRHKFRSMTCSIDGASQQTYEQYRVNGDFSKVIQNIRRLNAMKSLYHSEFPKLAWQFVVFSHNEHEISEAREMAASLDMEFRLKLSWDPTSGPVASKELLRQEIGAPDREEYRRRFGVDYAHKSCYALWSGPQINWDGKMMGCSRNFWGDFGADAFHHGLATSVNAPRMRRARQMLLGKKPAADDIPCCTCDIYLDMLARGAWIKPRDIRAENRLMARSRWSPRVRKSIVYRGARFAYRSFKPVSGSPPRLITRTYPLSTPLPADEDNGWKPYWVFRGSTRALQLLTCHVSVLAAGTSPHPPHSHKDEEILMLLSGELDLTLPDIQTPGEAEHRHLLPGQFVYYPSGFAHTIKTTSDEPADYLMFKWSSRSAGARSTLGFGLFDTREPQANGEVREGFSSRRVFDGSTSFLRRLHCHCSTLAPGAGYEPHIDPYDVAIIVLEGEVETLAERVRPHGVIFYAAGEPHGMCNPGQTVARYVVFEFHGRKRLARPLL